MWEDPLNSPLQNKTSSIVYGSAGVFGAASIASTSHSGAQPEVTSKVATGLPTDPAHVEHVVIEPMTAAALSPVHAWNVLSWPLRRKLRVFWLLLVAAVFCTLPMLLWEMQKKSWAPHYQAWFISGLFCLLSIPVTLYEIALHLEYYSQPPLQRHIIRILLMVPIYALDSWFCLRFISARTVLTPIRELYEAYTIYNFFMYLIRYLEGELGPVEEYMANTGKSVPHFFPMQYVCQPWVGKELYRECRKGVLNYVILRPLTSIIMWITLISNPAKYEEGNFAWDDVWPYTAVINNVSQCWALYVLMLFYAAMHGELQPLHPLRKFVTIKLVVFFSFWQGFVITMLAYAGVIKAKASWRTYNATEDLAGGLQDFIICIEMFFAAIAFAWSFPPRDYMAGDAPGFWTSLHTLLDFTDVMDDVQDRVHEEYREITTRPIQKIMAPIRNNPLFSGKGKASRFISLAKDDESELLPLSTGVGWQAGSSNGAVAPPGDAVREVEMTSSAKFMGVSQHRGSRTSSARLS